MLESPSTLEKMHPENTNVLAPNIIDKYENQPVDLHSFRLTDFASNYVSKKLGDIPVKQDEKKSYKIPVSNVDEIERNLNVIVQKNKHGKIGKRNRPCVICFHNALKLENA